MSGQSIQDALLEEKIKAKTKARTEGYRAGKADHKTRCVRENPYDPITEGPLYDCWQDKYVEAMRGW